MSTLQEKANQRVSTYVISDGEHVITVVMIINNYEPLVGDIITITSFGNLGHTKKAGLVKKYDILKKNCDIIGTPVLYEKNSDKTLRQSNNNVTEIYTHNCRNDVIETKHNKENINSYINFIPLSQLTTFTKDIKLLVKINKIFKPKEFKSNKNNGTLFSFTIIDKEGSEMQVTGFTKAYEKFYNNICEGEIYEIYGGYLKVNDRKFSSLKSDYKLYVDESTEIIKSDKTFDIKISYDFVKIADIIEKQVFSVIDVLGYVLDVGVVSIIHTKKNEDLQMRKMMLIDSSSEIKIEMTLWSDNTDKEYNQGDVIAFKYIKVGDFGGRSLSTTESTIIDINPDIPEAYDLKKICSELCENKTHFNTMYNHMGGNLSNDSKEISFLRDILKQADERIDDNFQFPNYKIKAYIMNIRHDEKNFYTGCEKCKKKITRENNWMCLNCNTEFENPTYYYTLSLRVKDTTHEAYLDLYGNIAEKILGVSCEEYKNLLSTNDKKLKEISSKLEFKSFSFIIKPKSTIYNNTRKTRLSCYKSIETQNETEMNSLINKLKNIKFKN